MILTYMSSEKSGPHPSYPLPTTRMYIHTELFKHTTAGGFLEAQESLNIKSADIFRPRILSLYISFFYMSFARR